MAGKTWFTVRAVPVLLLVVAGAASCALANVTLEITHDTVYLSDGRAVECTVILKGKDSLTVLVGEEEKTFSSSDVLRVEYGVSSGERKTFGTAPVDGHEIIGSGGREQAVEPVAPPPPAPAREVPEEPVQVPPAQEINQEPPKPDKAAAGGQAGQRNRPPRKRQGEGDAERERKPEGGEVRPGKNAIQAEELIKILDEVKKRFKKENE